MEPFDYIIKTKEGEFVKVYAVNDFYSEPKEFCEHGFNGRRWKPSEVEVVVYPTKEGHRRSYKYLHTDIRIKKDEEQKERELKGYWQKNYSSKTSFDLFKEIYELGLNARKEE